MALLTMLFRRLGIPLAPHKTIGPTCILEYLGIELDTIKMQARLPQNKLERLRVLLDEFIARRTCTKRELLSLLGHLNFACRVIVPGRTFISRLIELSKGIKHLSHFVTISAEGKLDVRMWQQLLSGWNGISLFLDANPTHTPDMDLFTDASGIGYGGYYQGKWFQARWSRSQQLDTNPSLSIAFQELYPIVIACLLWGKHWHRKRILFHCDNLATVQIINKGRSKSRNIMNLMRRLVIVAASNSFAFQAAHIPGKINVIADSLSRFQITRFREAAPQANKQPCQIPSDVIFQ